MVLDLRGTEARIKKGIRRKGLRTLERGWEGTGKGETERDWKGKRPGMRSG